MRHWLMKSEPNTYSIDDLARDGTTHWDGVRNYQARNMMRDDMTLGDPVLFYHSSADPPGVAGLAQVARPGYPDSSAWDKSDAHYDAETDPKNPTWMMVDIEFVEKFPRFVSLDELQGREDLDGLMVIKKGMRLSIQPVDSKHFATILQLGRATGAAAETPSKSWDSGQPKTASTKVGGKALGKALAAATKGPGAKAGAKTGTAAAGKKGDGSKAEAGAKTAGKAAGAPKKGSGAKAGAGKKGVSTKGATAKSKGKSAGVKKR